MDSLLKNRSALIALVLVGLGVVLGATLNVAATVALTIVAAAAVVGVLMTSAESGAQLSRASDGARELLARATSAVRRAGEGERPNVPQELPAPAVLLYEEIDRLALNAGKSKSVENVGPVLVTALRKVSSGQEAPKLGEMVPDRDNLQSALEDLSERVLLAKSLEKQHAELQRKCDSTERDAREAERRLQDTERKLQDADARLSELDRKLRETQAKLTEAESRKPGLDDGARRDLEAGVAECEHDLSGALGAMREQIDAVETVTRTLKEMSVGLVEVARGVDKLATNAEESSSSILEVSATNQEVAENIANLARSVAQTVASIEQMTASIREVARNVDGLSLTAEETSSSMNEMDVSIDQVQSNANETARLSEEVSQDAERGAEAILKTIGEINRIKETSQQGVSVISSLGSRIEAIGQIVNVIDDVAEQTNLLALNAAIIAAQAGEHGKSFAVVADEIKDLAERAAQSTKEITDLIKTIQAESKNAIGAVERSATMVDRGVEVSNEAERALKKILESSRKSTNMVRAIARATVEQAKGSKQVTDAMGRIAETVQQIAAATAQQARGSEQIMKSAEQMRLITEHVERSAQEQSRGGRQIAQAIESIAGAVSELNDSHRTQVKSGDAVFATAQRIEDAGRTTEQHVKRATGTLDRIRRVVKSN
jgi:methyl-accepting chemotaxis protein